MATWKSDLIDAGGVGHSNVPKGMTITALATYLVPTTGPASTDTIQMVPMPKGAVVQQVMVTADGGTTNANFKVGIGSDTDLFIDDVQNDAAIKENLIADGNDDGHLYEFTADDTIDFLFDTAAPTAADTYQCAVTYHMTID